MQKHDKLLPGFIFLFVAFWKSFSEDKADILDMDYQQCWRLHFEAVGNTVQVKIHSLLQTWLKSVCDK